MILQREQATGYHKTLSDSMNSSGEPVTSSPKPSAYPMERVISKRESTVNRKSSCAPTLDILRCRELLSLLVTTVVAKLFNGVQPQKAFFGQKDAQQVVVVKQMARDLNFPVEIVVVPTAREADGLAMSSRNAYLDEAQRAAASVLYRAHQAALVAYQAGAREGAQLRAIMQQTIEAESLAKMVYVSCADPQTLQELNKISSGALLSMAVIIGKTRLIDNWVLE